jgi:hypothetical protein
MVGPEILADIVSGEQYISKSFGILTTVKLSNKSHDTELKVLKTYTTDLPIVTRLISLDKKRACISCVVRKKNSERNKNHNPSPLQVKWSVPKS